MKLLRTIRLDASDTAIFPSAAEPGDWAVSGAFIFVDRDPATLDGKERAALRSGFLGVPSFGWSTLAQVVEVDEPARSAAIEALARCLLERLGAPDMAAARGVAAEEIAFAASLCEHPPDTLITLERSVEGDTIREVFRSLQPRDGGRHWHAFSLADEPELEDKVELMRLARGADA
jgi:hypothetical protein